MLIDRCCTPIVLESSVIAKLPSKNKLWSTVDIKSGGKGNNNKKKVGGNKGAGGNRREGKKGNDNPNHVIVFLVSVIEQN